MNRREKASLLREVTAGYLFHKRYAVFYEIKLHPRKSGLRIPGGRADILAINLVGDIILVEIKSGLADYRADNKWRQYLPYCNRMYFCFPPGTKVPQELLDDPDVGVMMPRPDGYIRVVKKSKWRPQNGKLKKYTTLGLVYRAADRNSFTHKRVRWKETP